MAIKGTPQIQDVKYSILEVRRDDCFPSDTFSLDEITDSIRNLVSDQNDLMVCCYYWVRNDSLPKLTQRLMTAAVRTHVII